MKHYKVPELNTILISESDILSSSDTDISIGGLLDEAFSGRALSEWTGEPIEN